MLLDPWQADPATLVRDGEVTHWHPDDPKPMEVPYFHEFDNFSAAVRGEAEPLLGRDDAAGQARVLGALYESARSGQGNRALRESPHWPQTTQTSSSSAPGQPDACSPGASRSGPVPRSCSSRLEANRTRTRLRMAGVLGSPPTGASRPNPDRQVARNPCDEGGC